MLKTKTMAKKVTPKKMLKKKAVKTPKMLTKYGLINTEDFKNMDSEASFDIFNIKTSYQHAINSFLLHEGNEEELQDMCVVEIKMIGKPMVKTTRQITIKTK